MLCLRSYKLLIAMLAVACMALASSCASHRHVSRGASAEEDILNELVEQQKSVKDKKEKNNKNNKNKYVDRLLTEAFSWKGVPYRSGGTSKKGADCSGFVMQTFKNSLGISLPRVAAQQAEVCDKIDKRELRPGDLVFFHDKSKKKRISHVGLYVGNGQMIHASLSKGVTVTPIDSPYFAKIFHHAGRVRQFKELMK